MSNNNQNENSNSSAFCKKGVTLLCGFLGAGKTTLLKFILAQNNALVSPSKFAIIVNDMASLNIDETLVQEGDLMQTNEMIAMENGCICCSLQNDLQQQVIEISSSNKFDYILIEASGVSEPAGIASLFKECKDDHDDDNDHNKDHSHSVHELTYLDTCVTVVDSTEFLPYLENSDVELKLGKSIHQLLIEQIECADVIILNKIDLIQDKSILESIQIQIQALNTEAKIILSTNSQVDINEVTFTHLCKMSNFEFVIQDNDNDNTDSEVSSIGSSDTTTTNIVATTTSGCCDDNGSSNKSCCESKRTIETSVSKVILAPTSNDNKTKHGTRFGISSFTYEARRPFDFERLREKFISEYFVTSTELARAHHAAKLQTEQVEDQLGTETNFTPSNMEYDDDDEEFEEMKEAYKTLAAAYKEVCKKYNEPICDELELDPFQDDENDVDREAMAIVGDEIVQLEDQHHESTRKERNEYIESSISGAIHKKAMNRRAHRYDTMGELMRMKGFIWTTKAHDLMQTLSSAGDFVSSGVHGRWNILKKECHTGTPAEMKALRKKCRLPWGDRRQELVFIGRNLNHDKIQQILDSCLLTDLEYSYGVDIWKAMGGDSFLSGLDV